MKNPNLLKSCSELEGIIGMLTTNIRATKGRKKSARQQHKGEEHGAIDVGSKVAR